MPSFRQNRRKAYCFLEHLKGPYLGGEDKDLDYGNTKVIAFKVLEL